MYSNEDFENLFVRYKAEGLPRKMSVKEFCIRNKVPFNLFDKWYRDTRHRIVPVSVEGKPDDQREEGAPASPRGDLVRDKTENPPAGTNSLRIMIDIRMTNGMHIHQRNLNYGELRSFVEKLEVLC